MRYKDIQIDIFEDYFVKVFILILYNFLKLFMYLSLFLFFI